MDTEASTRKGLRRLVFDSLLSNLVLIFDSGFVLTQILLELERIEQDDDLTYEVVTTLW